MSASGLKVDVADPAINRYRPTVLIADENMTGNVGKQRAEWERQRNNAEGQRSTATVQGWTKPDGSLWLPNQIVRLNAPQLGLDGAERLIVECAYTLDENGTKTVLTLVHRDAFDEPPEPLNLDKDGKKTKSKGKKAKKAKGDTSEFDKFTNQPENSPK